MLVAAVAFGLDNDFLAGTGAALLSSLHACLFVGIWILVPTMTADCLSRERREGTLPLLFLTNLRPFDIVLAKATAHALRAFTFWLATLPAMTLPFLIGGASWQHAMLSALLNFTAMCLALGAGVLASSHCKSWVHALVGGLALASAFGFGLCVLNVFLFHATVWSHLQWGGHPPSGVLGSPNALTAGVWLVSNLEQLVTFLGGIPGGADSWMHMQAWIGLGTLLFLWCCFRFAARNVARHWRDEPPSAFVRWAERKLCTPVVAVDFLKRWMRRTLSRNPVGWLEVRSWNARLTVWVWFGLIVVFYSFALADLTPSGLRALQPQAFIGWLLAGSIAFNAAGSFRRERESGVLELLLVSPLSVAEIVNGRLLGIWGQFLPATGLLVAISASLAGWATSHQESDMTWFFAITFLTLPVVGLYFSLARQHFFSAVVWTLAIGLILPALIGPVSHWLTVTLGTPAWRSSPMTRGSPLQIVIAAVLWRRLHRHLAERRFNLERSIT